ncbi:S10 family peptidase [Nitrospirillum iridis]|uniref:Carboxypeptidase C (Cathepsin A) n=1 Tax=Nitrospirillum iridis TaxID=765888 RepID=A0A7X0AW84_9PROT|nr:peptidase S10 [Nitrospirillum iridis]MBB6250847.1 carboxypeptidase C (cathepsin A) [Nitrospirillum iridis]
MKNAADSGVGMVGAWVRGLVLGLMATAAPMAALAQGMPVPEIAGHLLGPVATPHSITLNGRAVRYTATFAETVLKDDGGKPLATLSSTAYVASPVLKARPVLFVFNGGPGASSSPLHFGAFGPRSIVKGADGNRSLADNPHSLLADADLVFIDPVGTGFSRVLPGGDGHPYWTPEGDAQAVLGLIRDWLRDNGRTASPVYLAGESYGGFRLATMMKFASDTPIAGLVLISPALDFSATADDPGNDLPHIFELPAMAVTAWKHGRAKIDAQTPEQVFQVAADYAQGPYALALLKGGRLPVAEREAVAARLADLIGLPAKTIADANLRVDTQVFLDTLLVDQGLVVGRLDGRVTGPAPKDAPADRPAAAKDPALGLGRSNVITSTVATDYFRHELNLPVDRDYVSLTLDVNFSWNYMPTRRDQTFYVNAAPNIATVMKAQPKTRLLLVGGYYDMAVPLLSARYAIDRAGIPLDRVTVAAFDAGHSPFEGEAGLARMQEMMHGFLVGR